MQVRYIITFLFFAFVTKSNAQGYYELLNITYDIAPLQIKDPNGNQNFNCSNIKINDVLPVFLKKDRSQFLLTGLNLESLTFPGTHTDLPVSTLYSIAPFLGYGRSITKRLILATFFIPDLNADMKKITNSDIKTGGFVRGSYRVNKDLSVKLSIGCLQQFFGPQYILLAGFDWKLTDKWRLFGDFPAYATLSYSMNPRVNAGFTLYAVSTSYHLTTQNQYLEYTYSQPGIFAERYLTPKLALRGTVTYSVLRNLYLYNMNNKTSGGGIVYVDNGPQTTALNTEVSKGLAFRLSLGFRIPEQKK